MDHLLKNKQFHIHLVDSFFLFFKMYTFHDIRILVPHPVELQDMKLNELHAFKADCKVRLKCNDFKIKSLIQLYTWRGVVGFP